MSDCPSCTALTARVEQLELDKAHWDLMTTSERVQDLQEQLTAAHALIAQWRKDADLARPIDKESRWESDQVEIMSRAVPSRSGTSRCVDD